MASFSMSYFISTDSAFASICEAGCTSSTHLKGGGNDKSASVTMPEYLPYFGGQTAFLFPDLEILLIVAESTVDSLFPELAFFQPLLLL